MVVVKYKTGNKAGTYVGKGKAGYYRAVAKPITDVNRARVYTNASYAKRSLSSIKQDIHGRWVPVPFEENFEIVELKVEAVPVETPLFN